MCAPLDQAPPTLADAIGRAHCWSEHALSTPGHQVLGSVWWLSTHLAATERVVHPVASEMLANGSSRVAEQRRRAGEIVRLLWTIEHSVSGDARVRGPVASVVRRLSDLVREHADAEDALVAELEATLPDAMLALLHRRYTDTVRRAPTRPHPVTAGRPRLAAAAFRIGGVVDHVRDVVDGRAAPRRLAG
jgi:hypothetical protein